MMSARLRTRAALLLAGPILLGLSLGCGRLGGPKDKIGAVGPPTADKEDPIKLAADKFLQAQSPADYREGLRDVGFALKDDEPGRAEVKQGADELVALKDRLGLDPDELDEVTSPNFRPLDAHHVAFCFQLREVIDGLQLQGLPPLRQAEVAFGWVTRQLLLRGGDDSLLPPPLALARGEGNAQERAFLFLQLLRQLDIDGCMMALPGSSPERPRYWAAGALVNEGGKTDIYLFDTRLGLPLPGPGGKGVATLAQVRSDPRVLRQLTPDDSHPYDVTPEQANQAEAHLVCPLSALAPRMGYLEERLQGRDHVRLAVRPAKALKRLEEVSGGKAGVWNRPSEAGSKVRPLTPLRTLRLYLPPDEGGLGQGQPPGGIIPWSVVLANYRSLGVLDELADKGQEQLKALTNRLFVQYVVVPQQQLTRGRLDEATRKLSRIRDALVEFDQARMPRSVQLEQAARWRDDLNEAYLALNRGAPGASDRIRALWLDDQYLLGLLADTEEEPSTRKTEDSDPRLKQKKALTFVVLGATAESLRDAVEYLLALCSQEKAERAQNRASHGQASAARRASEAWLTAADWAGTYANHYPLTVSAVGKRSEPIVRSLAAREKVEVVAELWDQLFRDVRRAAACRLGYADAQRELGKNQEAVAALARLGGEVDSLRSSAELKTALAESGARLGALHPTVRAKARADLESLARELAPGGAVTWMGHSALVLRRLQELRP